MGVLGVVPGEPTVSASEFPDLSATIRPHGQKISVFRGDTIDLAVRFQDDKDPPSPVSLQNAILKFAAKLGYGLPVSPVGGLGNEAALVVKASYWPDQIEIRTPVTEGRAIVYLSRQDTWSLPPGQLLWDLELARPMEEVAPPGVATLTLAANGIANFTGLNLLTLGIRQGYRLTIVIGASTYYALIADVISSTSARLDRTDLPAVIASSFTFHRATIKTVASGLFIVYGDVVR